MPRLEVFPGPGVVLRFGEVCAWAAPQASSALLQFLDQSARNLGPSDRGGTLLADHVTGVLVQHDPEPAAAFVTIGPDDGGLAVILHGPVQLWDGAQWLTPRPEVGWLRTTLRPAPLLLAGPAGSQPFAGRSQPLLDLESGAVPGGGFALVDPRVVIPAAPPAFGARPREDHADPHRAEDREHIEDQEQVGEALPAIQTETAEPSSPDTQPDTEPNTAETEQTTGEESASDQTGVLPTTPGDDSPTRLLTAASVDPTVRLPTDDPGAEAGRVVPGDRRPLGVFGLLPPPKGVRDTTTEPLGAVRVVRGVRCERGHFNHVDSPSCVRCGRPISFVATAAVSGPRPPLGVLVVDDGRVYALERALLLGSGALRAPMVTGGTARGLTLSGDGVSEAHAEIRLNEWVVTLVDHGSPGGTHVLALGDDGWTRLAPFEQAVLRPGTHVALGSRVLTYLSPWPG